MTSEPTTEATTEPTTEPTTEATPTLLTRIMSVSVPVADQDEALAFYTDVLGCEVRNDVELAPGARWLEVAPPGSAVTIALVPADGTFPIGVRFGTADADSAYAQLTEAGASVHESVLRLGFAPPMFTLGDPDGNTVILIEEPRDS